MERCITGEGKKKADSKENLKQYIKWEDILNCFKNEV